MIKNKPHDYRRLSANPTRFYVAHFGKYKSWLKVDELGNVLEATNAFAWAIDKPIEVVQSWCNSKNIILRKMHGNIKHIDNYK